MQSDRTLITQFYFFSLHSSWDFLLLGLGNKSTKRKKNEAKLKNQSKFFKTNNFKRVKNHKLLAK